MKKLMFALAFTLPAIASHASEPFSGLYTDSGVDSMSQLMLLDNQRFCFAVSAGSLDLITGGKWQKVSQKANTTTLHLQETQLDLSNIFLTANPHISESTLADTKKEMGEQRVLFITPPALEEAIGDGEGNALLAFSDSSTVPSAFKYFYAKQAGTPMYLHIAIPSTAQYLFIGSPANDKLYRFNIGTSQYVKINANPQAGRRAIDLNVVFNNKTHELKSEHDSSYGTPRQVAKQQQDEAWQQCQPKMPNLTTSVSGTAKTLLAPDSTLPLNQYVKQPVTESWKK